MRDFQLKVLTAEKTFYDGPCVSLTIPTLDGLYGIMAGHENLVLAVVPGMMHITDAGGGELFAAVSGGIFKIESNTAVLLVDSAERPEDIDELRANEAVERAKEEMRMKKSGQEYKMAEQHLMRALWRLRSKKYGKQ